MGNFAIQDWLVFIAYIAVLSLSGWLLNRKKSVNTNDYFLGGNEMSTWLVAISVLATSQSAATFLGGPDQGYRGDYSYLATNIGALLAALFVAFFLIPKFYHYKVTTVYQLLGKRFGESAQKQAGMMYLFGRVFASGARLYMAAIAVSMILFNDIEADHVVISTLMLAMVGLVYTVFGGIRTVIYSDAIQCAVYVLAAILVLYFLLDAIPASPSEIINALSEPQANGHSKLTVLDLRHDFSSTGVFTIWSAITGFALLNMAAFGLDQDMTQRLLTCKSKKESSMAMLYSVLLVIPVMAVFIAIGSLLYIYYQRPDIMLSSDSAALNPQFSGEKITIFMYYVLNEIPAGVKGLVTVGVIAAALSTLNSGLNSMSSVIVMDIYKPWLAKQNIEKPEHHFVNAGRLGMTAVATCLSLMAILCFYWQKYSDTPLLAFALSVMVFSYSGLIGVYLTAVFTKRGNNYSVLAALVAGFAICVLFQPYVMDKVLPAELSFNLGFTWQLCIASSISFLICMLGSKSPKSSQSIILEATQ